MDGAMPSLGPTDLGSTPPDRDDVEGASALVVDATVPIVVLFAGVWRGCRWDWRRFCEPRARLCVYDETALTEVLVCVQGMGVGRKLDDPFSVCERGKQKASLACVLSRRSPLLLSLLFVFVSFSFFVTRFRLPSQQQRPRERENRKNGMETQKDTQRERT